MKLTLIRKWFGTDKTISKMLINGKLKFYSLEDVVRKKGEKIAKVTAIPYGTYNVTVSHSPKLGRRLPLINDVPMFSGIRIHSGKDESWTEGCVLVSERIIDGKLVLDYKAEEDLIKLIDDAISKGEKVTITITNAQKRYIIFAIAGIVCISILILLFSFFKNKQ